MHWLAAMSSRCALARVLPGKTLLSCKWHLDPRRCDRAARPDASVWQLNALQYAGLEAFLRYLESDTVPATAALWLGN